MKRVWKKVMAVILALLLISQTLPDTELTYSMAADAGTTVKTGTKSAGTDQSDGDGQNGGQTQSNGTDQSGGNGQNGTGQTDSKS